MQTKPLPKPSRDPVTKSICMHIPTLVSGILHAEVDVLQVYTLMEVAFYPTLLHSTTCILQGSSMGCPAK